ncbi:lipoate--protein ligase family protein [Psychromonas sp. SP041]|uniref:lipoate--protein ligase family protein n=1 Tax=Psychromonas sp. SP041 TaxID=1365007 RepID=UPI00041C7F99|nr:lipoate--protein ligase family protein [Psychromonas sp. SP041]
MIKNQNKLLRYTSVSVANVFEKETAIIAQIQANEISKCLILWQTKTPTIVFPANKKWPESTLLKTALQKDDWKLLSRKTGGAPVPQCQGIINLSHLYVWDDATPYSITQAYENLCQVLKDFFSLYGLNSETHATEFSYCDGDFNININGRKIVGTAQRIILKKGGGKIILAQACILIDAVLEEIIKPINLCYQLCDKKEQIKAQVHTTLFEHINTRPSVEVLYQQLTQAFVDNGLG